MKRNQLKLIGIIAGLGILFTSCWFMGPSVKGNGNVTEEVRHVDDFEQIKVSRGMNVYIIQGSPAKVLVIADSNLHESIETEVNGDVLTVSVNENIRWAKEKKVMITIEKLSRLQVSSGANAYSQAQITSENLEIKASSGAKAKMEVNTNYLKAECSSGANIYLAGEAKQAELETSSGANLKGAELKAGQCKMKASSGGNVASTVIGKLEAKASGGGNIVYYGEPSTTDIDTSSGGNVKRK